MSTAKHTSAEGENLFVRSRMWSGHSAHPAGMGTLRGAR